MVFDAGTAARFVNIHALEEMKFSSLSWWYPATRRYAKMVRKGEVL
ncbi:MAG: hypothetical protein LBK08_10340 [Treponema sp.]|jgi:hypothetical protein|nr:hypothetical protein [Treponema sp.]